MSQGHMDRRLPSWRHRSPPRDLPEEAKERARRDAAIGVLELRNAVDIDAGREVMQDATDRVLASPKPPFMRYKNSRIRELMAFKQEREERLGSQPASPEKE
jgi:hypothetical protein